MDVNKLIKSSKKTKSKKAKAVDDDFDVDLDDTSRDVSSEGKKAKRSERRADKSDKKSKKDKKDKKAAKSDKAASRAEKRKARKEAKSSGKAVKGKKSKADKPAKDAKKVASVTEYKGDLGKLLASDKLDKPGKLVAGSPESAYNHFVHQLNKGAAKLYSQKNVAGSISKAVGATFGIKMKTDEFSSAANKIRTDALAKLAKSAKASANKLKKSAKAGDLTMANIESEVEALLAVDE